ncbi:MAG: hypothetical protein IPO48_07370 [Saprospiraceae bacterium]|nr:hypothetical protein [Saprospiraceae bacterium]
MITFKSQLANILTNHPEYTRELIILLGVIKLCDELDVKSFETIVKTFGIKSNQWWPLINEITEDDDWENIIEGELYQHVLNLQMWIGTHDHDIEEGSVLWFLMQKRNNDKKD